MKICFFSSNSLSSGGGVENWIIEVSRRLVENHEVSIVGLKYAEARRLSFDRLTSMLNGIDYYEIPFIKPPRGAAIPSLLHIKHVLDLFNSCNLTYTIVPCAPVEALLYSLKGKLKCKLIAGFHAPFLRSDIILQRLYVPIFTKSLDAFHAYHVLNKEVYCWLRRRGFCSIFHIANGVDTKRFKLSKKPSDSQTFNVLFTGRFTEDKGFDILIEIIRYFNENLHIRNAKFTIIGSGPLKGMLEEITRKYENVRCLGFVPIFSPGVLPSLYQSAHLLLMPSRTEGMPLSLLEAQSCGLPALASNIAGMSDLITNGKNGSLNNIGDVMGFANTIKEYYELWHNSPGEYYEMNESIREYTVKNYDWDIIIKQLEKMFTQCNT